ncbi:MAG: hypothetical protein WBL45_08860 [Solirubrobacterales bacterium]
MNPRSLWSLAVVFAALLVGCGGGGSSDEEQVRELLLAYYEDSAPAQCETMTTARFRSVVYGGSGDGAMAACKEHQRGRQETTELNKAVFVDQVRIDGDRAVAEVRGGGITQTEGLVKAADKWRLDDEASPFHESGGTLPDTKAAEDAAKKEKESRKVFGEPARFTNIPQFPPPAAVTLVAKTPIDPGTDRTGAEGAKGRLGDEFGQPGPVTEFRFVNLPITLTNTGTRPFRGEVGATATGKSGREYVPLDRRDIAQGGGVLGRLPDWTAGEPDGIAPNASTTRYLTVAVPVNDRIVEWRVEPHVLSEPGTVMLMEPIEGVTYRD